MHGGLADSLRHIQEQCAGKVPFDRTALAGLVTAIEQGRRFPPSTFALYYDLVPALLRGEDESAAALIHALVRERPIESPLLVLGLDHPALAGCRERYLRFMNSDDPYSFEFLPPTPEQVRNFVGRFARASDLMEQAMPELRAEMRAVVSEIILVVGPPDAKMVFDGGSSYRLWGALFLNADRHPTRTGLVEVLAHETGHCVLFGLGTEEAHVLNPDDERFPSPLRLEDRPMDGVFHATYVSARMHWALSRLVASGLLTEEERSLAIAARDEDRRNFEQGYEIVAAYARLTDTGRRAIGAALAYMKAAA